MDQTTIGSHFSKKSLPILLSISAFSILFSFSFLPINDFSNQMRSYITDKNSIFLFCNGILVLIIKSSGFANNSSLNTESKQQFAEKREDQAENKADCKEAVTVEGEEEQVNVYESLGEEEKEDEYGCEEEDDFLVIEDDGFGLLSTEELNQKCDDFIRKMREGIKFQA